MTERARLALADCELALELLEKETDFDLWRVHWVAALTLCRLVGHVLEKVDAHSEAQKAVVKHAYSAWKSNDPDHEIFREFIEKNRNSLLKEYEFKQFDLEAVPVVYEMTLRHPETGEIRKIRETAELPDNIYRPLIDSYREGDDARDVLKEAITWWEKQLDEIDAAFLALPIRRA